MDKDQKIKELEQRIAVLEQALLAAVEENGKVISLTNTAMQSLSVGDGCTVQIINCSLQNVNAVLGAESSISLQNCAVERCSVNQKDAPAAT